MTDDDTNGIEIDIWPEPESEKLHVRLDFLDEDDIVDRIDLFYEYDTDTETVAHPGDDWMPDIVRVTLEELDLAAWDDPDTDDGHIVS
jgi:hypothetical protein